MSKRPYCQITKDPKCKSFGFFYLSTMDNRQLGYILFVLVSVAVVLIGLKTLGVYFALAIPLFMLIFIIIAKKNKK